MIREMLEKGATVSSIAREMGIDRKTVRKYASSDNVPAYGGRHRASKLDPFREYIREMIDRYDLSGTRLLVCCTPLDPYISGVESQNGDQEGE